MLRRCLRSSGLAETAVRQTYWAGAPCQAFQPYRTEACAETCWNSSSTSEYGVAATHKSTAAVPPDVPKTLPTCQADGRGLHARLHFLPRGIYTDVHKSLTRTVSRDPAPASSLYHRHYHETPASWQSRSFAKASRLVHPASRAAKKLEERLPASRRSSDNVSDNISQPPLEGHESSHETDVITRAEESRASDVQVHPPCCCHSVILLARALKAYGAWQHLHATCDAVIMDLKQHAILLISMVA